MQKYIEQYEVIETKRETIGDAMNLWLEQKRGEWKPSTYANHRRIVESHLMPYWMEIYPEALDADEVRKFIMTKKDEGLSNGYIKNIYGVFHQALKYYENEHDDIRFKIPVPTWIDKRESKENEKKIPSIEIINEIEEILYAEEIPEQAGMLIAINSGIRIGELCALQWSDVDLDSGIIHINKTMQRVRTYADQSHETRVYVMKPKSESYVRDIPLPSKLVNFLNQKKGRPGEYVVPGKKVDFCEPRTLQYRFERFLMTNGFEVFQFNALRHCFASRCVELGFDAKSLCEIMGYSDIHMTSQLYAHTSLSQKRVLMERLNKE